MVNESYFYTHETLSEVPRKKRKRVNEYDPRADQADIDYQNNYGL